EANFIPSPFIPVSGSYSGLFYEGDQVRQHSAGSFNVSITAHGAYSGKVKLGPGRHSFSGKLSLQCEGSNLIVRAYDRSLSLQLRVGTNEQLDTISGRLSDGNWSA